MMLLKMAYSFFFFYQTRPKKTFCSISMPKSFAVRVLWQNFCFNHCELLLAAGRETLKKSWGSALRAAQLDDCLQRSAS